MCVGVGETQRRMERKVKSETSPSCLQGNRTVLAKPMTRLDPLKKNQKNNFFERSELAPLIELTVESQRRQGRPPEVKVVPLRENTA